MVKWVALVWLVSAGVFFALVTIASSGRGSFVYNRIISYILRIVK